jgi:hypothetical protein
LRLTCHSESCNGAHPQQIPHLHAIKPLPKYEHRADPPQAIADLMLFFLVFVFFIALILLPYAYPVWILRNRIKDKN